MAIEVNVLQSNPIEYGVPQRSPVLLIVIVIYTTPPIEWVQERVKGVEGLVFVDNLE